MSGYGAGVTTPRDPAAYAAAEAEARAAIGDLAQAEETVHAARVRRDAAIRKMSIAGYSAPEIGRTLGLPKSTVIQSIKNDIVRTAS